MENKKNDEIYQYNTALFDPVIKGIIAVEAKLCKNIGLEEAKERAIKSFKQYDLGEKVQGELNDADAWAETGLYFWGIENCILANKCLDIATKINPNDVANWTVRGRLLAYSGNYETAIKCYDNALDLCPDYPPDIIEERIYAQQELNKLWKYQRLHEKTN